MKKTTKSKKSSKNKQLNLITILAPILLAITGGIGATMIVTTSQGEIKLDINYSETKTVTGDEGEYIEEIPTVDEIDGGGKFKDALNVGEAESDVYYELGKVEEVDTSSVDAFVKSTLNRCIIADNYFGAQCVSLARAFWWDYAGFDVSTCGTGLAKGMMNCYEENARDKFKVIWNTNEIQKGTWIVLDGSRTGHICMALGKVKDGYVTCLGENQGGVPCEYGVGGAGTNIINLSVKNFIGGYTPLDYIEPEPTPVTPDTGIVK